MSQAGDEQVIAADAPISGPMTVEEALQEVLKASLIKDGLYRGLRECVKVMDRREAKLCVLVETCTEAEYVKLVESLCAEHNVNLIKVSDGKKLGAWAGLCKIDREGNPRKVVGASVVTFIDKVVVKDIDEKLPAWAVLQESFKN